MGRHRARARAPRGPRAILIATVAALVGMLCQVSTADAAPAPAVGHLDRAAQSSSGVITINGWAF
ncbi:MAG: hypothetical protein JWO57_3883, partial [Pseudonocardiales bacterium]|nr:hypothetical protein [Pseudonocardiales bacterium]